MTFNKTFIQKNRSSSNNNLILRRNTTPLNSFYHCKLKIPYNVLLHCINIKFLRFHIFLLSSLKLLTKVKSSNFSFTSFYYFVTNLPWSTMKLFTYFHTWYNKYRKSYVWYFISQSFIYNVGTVIYSIKYTKLDEKIFFNKIIYRKFIINIQVSHRHIC